MDPKIKDESRNRRREEALARRLGEALDQTPLRGTELCPDAELIAAYNEHVLGSEETAQCENHIAACSRCRNILSVLAASADTPLAEKEVARLGELVAAASLPRGAATPPAVPARSKLLHWRASWLVPALGVAAVLAVWFAMKPPWRSAVQNSSTTLIAEGPQSEPTSPQATSPVDQFSKAERAQNQKTNSATPSRNLKDLPATRTESGKPAAETPAKKGLDNLSPTDGLAPRAKVAESATSDEKKNQAAENNAVASTPTPAPPSLLPPPADSVRRPLAQARSNGAGQATPPAPKVPDSVTASTEASPVATAGSVASGSTSRDKNVPTTNVILGSKAEPRKDSNLPVNGRNFQTLMTVQPGAETFIISTQPPNTAIGGASPSNIAMWRAGKGGSIEYSADTGRSWRPQSSPLREDWLSGAPVSKTICWIVGRNGAIARTVDAEHWEKVASPQMSADASGKFPDWIDVKATSAQLATITARDQRHYSTQDGGKTWQ